MICKNSSMVMVFWLIMNAPLYSQTADFSNFVVVGDSLSAGFQNFQLIESSQIHSYANVIATQAGVSLNLPLLPSPGYPQISYVSNFAVATGLDLIARRNTQQTRDLAVPGFTAGALVGLPPLCNPLTSDFLYPIKVMAAEILNPGCSPTPPSELVQAAGLKPTTAILWVGSNDALFSILFGIPTTPVDGPTGFAAAIHAAATTMAGASGSLVMATIPDVTLTPYLTPVPKLAAILHMSVSSLQTLFGLNPGDMVTPYAFQAIQAMNVPAALANPAPPAPPLVIRADTVAQIRDAVVHYNAVIAYEAAANHATLVDIYSLVNNLAAKGIVVGGQRLTTDFQGGLFSLDGLHPTNTGYAVIANEFIKTMNRSLGTDIPPVSIQQVSKTDPLIFGASGPGKSDGHVSIGMAGGVPALVSR